MKTRGKNKKGRKKKYNKKRTRKMKGRGIFSGPRYNPLRGPFKYRDSGNILRGQQLGEPCSNKKGSKCAQNLWCNHYLSQEDADEWLLNYYDNNKTEDWKKQMTDLYGAENEMFDVVGTRRIDREFAAMEAADKADAAAQLSQQKKEYRTKSRNTTKYCKLPLLRRNSKTTRTEELFAINKATQEEINTETEKLSTLTGEEKKTQLAKIQQLKEGLHNTSDILPEWKYCKNFCSRDLIKGKNSGNPLPGKWKKKSKTRRFTSVNRIGCLFPDDQPDKGNLGQFVPGNSYKNQKEDDDTKLDTKIKMFEGKYYRIKKGTKHEYNDACGCVNWMSADERAQLDINTTKNDIKGIWESLYPSTKPKLERNDEGEFYWETKKSVNFKKWREKDNWNLGVVRYEMLDGISDDPKGKDKQERLNKIQIDNMILNLHYKLKLLYNYLVNPKNIKTKFVYTIDRSEEEEEDDEIIWEGVCAFLDETNTEKTMKKWEEEHPGFSKCFYRTLVKKQFAQRILPITDEHNEMLNKEEKDANDILTKIKDLPNTRGDMFWKWIAGQSIVPGYDEAETDEEEAWESWELMNNNIVEGFKKVKPNIYKELTNLANKADPNAYETVFEDGFKFITDMIENDLRIRGPPKPFLGKKAVFNKVKANLVNNIKPCSGATSGGGKKRKTRKKKR